MSCRYILDIDSLSVESFANTFSYSVAFFLFHDFLSLCKNFCLIRSHSFIFVFIFITLGGGSKKILLQVYVKKCSACFPLRSLYYLVLHLSVLSTLSLFLCMVLENVLISLISMWQSSFPSTTY